MASCTMQRNPYSSIEVIFIGSDCACVPRALLSRVAVGLIRELILRRVCVLTQGRPRPAVTCLACVHAHVKEEFY